MSYWREYAPFALILCLSQAVNSAETEMDRSARVLEDAARQATVSRQQFRAQSDSRVVQGQFASPAVVDPRAVAERYEKRLQQLEKEEELLVFISTSMPREALVRLGRQVAAAGGVLVLRGFKGGLARGAMTETLRELKPLIDVGARIEINPEAFTHFQVVAAPTYVLAVKSQTCAEEHCEWQGSALVGDVSLDYVLEHWVGEGGRVGQLARRYLIQMRGDAR